MADEDVGMDGLEGRDLPGRPPAHPSPLQGAPNSLPVDMEVAVAEDVSHRLRQTALVKFMEARMEAFTALHNLHEVYTRLSAEDRVRPVVKASLLLSWVRMDLPKALSFYHQLHASPVTQWVHLFARQQGRSAAAFGQPSTLFSGNDTVDCLLRGFLARIEEEAIPEVVIWREVADAVTQSPQFATGRPAGSSLSTPELILQPPRPPLCPEDRALFDTGRFWDGLPDAEGSADTTAVVTDFVRDLEPYAKPWEAPPPPLPPPPGIQDMECHSEGSAHPDGAPASGASSGTKGTKRSLSLDRAGRMQDDEPRRSERILAPAEASSAQPGAGSGEPPLPPNPSDAKDKGWQGDLVMLMEAADGPDWLMTAAEGAVPVGGPQADGHFRGSAGAGSSSATSDRAAGQDHPLVHFPGPIRGWEQWPAYTGRVPKTEAYGSSWEDTLSKVRGLLNPAKPIPDLPSVDRQRKVFQLWSPSGWGAEYAVLDVGAVQMLLFSTPKKWLAGLHYIEDNPSGSAHRHYRTRVSFADRNWNKMIKNAILSNNAIAASTRTWQPDPLPQPVSRGFGKGWSKGKRQGVW